MLAVSVEVARCRRALGGRRGSIRTSDMPVFATACDTPAGFHIHRSVAQLGAGAFLRSCLVATKLRGARRTALRHADASVPAVIASPMQKRCVMNRMTRYSCAERFPCARDAALRHESVCNALSRVKSLRQVTRRPVVSVQHS